MATQVPKNFRTVIVAASVGNVIEWYNFYIFGSLAANATSMTYNILWRTLREPSTRGATARARAHPTMVQKKTPSLLSPAGRLNHRARIHAMEEDPFRKKHSAWLNQTPDCILTRG